MKPNLTALTTIAIASLFLGIAAQDRAVAQQSSDLEKVKTLAKLFMRR
jgi:hypothetical protein